MIHIIAMVVLIILCLISILLYFYYFNKYIDHLKLSRMDVYEEIESHDDLAVAMKGGLIKRGMSPQLFFEVFRRSRTISDSRIDFYLGKAKLYFVVFLLLFFTCIIVAAQ